MEKKFGERNFLSPAGVQRGVRGVLPVGSVETSGASNDGCDHACPLLGVALTVSGLLVVQRVTTAELDGLDVIEHEGPWVQVGQRVVDVFAADVAGWFVAGYSCAVLVA